MQKLNISTLQDPRDYWAENGTYALVGLYCRIYWESLALGDEIIAQRRKNDILPLSDKKPVFGMIKDQRDYENWLGIAAELLPEWATEFLAHYDSLLEGDAL